MTCEIIIPCYKESQRLPSFLGSLAEEISRRQVPATITAVDDGSGEAEATRLKEIVSRARAGFPQVINPPMLLTSNRGKGGAVRAGWQEAGQRGVDLLCFADADGATSAEEVCNLITHLMSNASGMDGVLGSRVKLLGKTIERHFRRHLVGRCFATLTTLITGLEVYDSQCGAKVIKRELFDAIHPLLQEDGFVFDVELILAALQAGFKLVEVPVSWHEVPGSRLNILAEVFRMGVGLTRIRKHLGTLPVPLRAGVKSR